MRRRFLALLGFAAGALAGSVVLRRQFGKRRDRVEVYFDDGSMITSSPKRYAIPRMISARKKVLA